LGWHWWLLMNYRSKQWFCNQRIMDLVAQESTDPSSLWWLLLMEGPSYPD
jgi:hypothetical protein